MLTAVIGVMATVTGLARAWPQVIRIISQPHCGGVSSLTWTLTLCTSIAWAAIGIVEHIAVAIVFNILNGIGAVAVLLTLAVRRHVGVWPPIAATVITANACVAMYAVAGAVGVSALGVGVSVVRVIPQAVKAVRHSTAGVSATTWALSLVTSLLWMFYGLLIDEFVLIAPTIVVVPAAGLIIWKTLLDQRRALARPATVHVTP